MRKIILAYTFSFFTLLLFAQNTPINLDQKININLNGQTVDSVINEISKLSNINFSFSHDQINTQQIIDFNANQETVKIIMDRLAEQINIQFIILDKHIILKPPKVINTTLVKDKEKHTVSGYIKDGKNGEVLIGATIYIPEIENGVATNAYGFYSITLPEGDYSFQVSSLGFKAKIEKIKLKGNVNFDFPLQSSYTELETVEISAIEHERNEIEEHLDEVKMIPTILTGLMNNFGEVEVIKSLQSIPGVNTQGDGSVFFFVRGGNKDQNLILLDEAPIYNPSHLLGFFSSFAPDAIKDVTVYKSNIPASFGGMLSSVVDIRTKDGNMYAMGGYANFNPFTSSFSLEGPIIEEKCSYYASFRRSHMKWLIRDPNQALKFRDFNLKLNYKMNENNRFFLTYYNGYDYFGSANTKISDFGISWGNKAFTLRWNHLFNDKLFSNTTFYASKYNYFLYINRNENTYWNEQINNGSLKTDFTYFKNDRNTMHFGYQIKAHGFNPGNIHSDGNKDLESLPRIPIKQASSFNLYYSNIFKAGKKWEFNYGLRLSTWTNVGPTTEWGLDSLYQVVEENTMTYADKEDYLSTANLEPRLSAQYQLDSSSFTKLSYDKTTQYIHLLSNSVSPFTSLEVWVPTGPNIDAQIAHNVTLGYYKLTKNEQFKFVTELYYRDLQNQIDFIDHPNLILNPYLETQIRTGRGWAYGLELSVEKLAGNLKGKISYNLTKSMRQIEGINNGEAYVPFSDRPYDFNVNLVYQKTRKWTWTANWISMSGLAFSSPVGYFEYQGSLVPVINQKNNDRLPDYKRLDLSVTRKLNKDYDQRYQHEVSFSLYNALAFSNPISINFNKIEDHGFKVPTNLYGDVDYVTTELSLIRMIPSINYTLRF